MQQNNPWFYFSTHLYKTHENEQLQNLNWNGPTRTEPLYDHTQDNFTTFNQGRQPYVLHFWVIFNLIHFPLHLPEPCQPSPDRCTLPHYFNRTEKKKKSQHFWYSGTLNVTFDCDWDDICITDGTVHPDESLTPVLYCPVPLSSHGKKTGKKDKIFVFFLSVWKKTLC